MDQKKKGIPINQKKEIARLYYFNGDTQVTISEKVGVTRTTLSRWIKEGCWESTRAASKMSRKELIFKMLKNINDKLEAGTATSDEMIRVANAIEKIDKKTNAVTIIECFTAYDNWLVARMQIDPDLTPEIIQVINRYQDLFISESLTNTSIEFKD